MCEACLSLLDQDLPEQAVQRNTQFVNAIMPATMPILKPLPRGIHILTIATPSLSARVMYTKKVESTTDINGATAGTQKNFLAIVIAAPPIKPTIAAWDRKSIKNPNLVQRSTQPKYHHSMFKKGGAFHEVVLNTRVKSVIPKNSKSCLSNPSEKGRVPNKRETTATGPIAISRELPMTA
ncbi:hypothetical protein Lal_00048309 [Lupinus albus]|nr:hypothetical protein Lal_00048309 [Lupinus albus]